MRLAALALLAVSCGKPSTAPSPDLGPPSVQQFTLSGTVVESTPQGARPVVGAAIERAVDEGGSVHLRVVATTDANGRYIIPNLPSGTEVALRVLNWHQPCAATATVTADTVLDIEVVTWIFATMRTSPTLSGTVFYTTPEGVRRPYADGAPVGFFSNCRGMNLVRAITDDSGRYQLCRLPPGPACLTLGVWESGSVRRNVNIQGDTFLDRGGPSASVAAAPAVAAEY